MRDFMESYLAKLRWAVRGLGGMILFFFTTPEVFAATSGVIQAPSIALSGSYITTSLCHIVDWMFYGLIVLAIIMVLLAGYNYVTAAGDPEKVSKASKMILYAAIGIVVGLVAKGFPVFIASIFTGGFNVSVC